MIQLITVLYGLTLTLDISFSFNKIKSERYEKFCSNLKEEAYYAERKSENL